MNDSDIQERIASMTVVIGDVDGINLRHIRPIHFYFDSKDEEWKVEALEGDMVVHIALSEITWGGKVPSS